VTKANFRILIRSAVDDPNAARWSDAVMDLFTAATIDSMYSDLFQVAPFLTSQLDTLTSLTSPGYFDKRITATGDLSQRLFRIQTIVRNGTTYTQGKALNLVMENSVEITGLPTTYILLGDLVYLFPLNTTDDVEIRYSFRPASYDDLADASDVVWPDGYETAAIYETAGRLLAKGAAEDNQGYLALAGSEFGRLKSAVIRGSVGPLTIMNMDESVAWGDA